MCIRPDRAQPGEPGAVPVYVGTLLPVMIAFGHTSPPRSLSSTGSLAKTEVRPVTGSSTRSARPGLPRDNRFIVRSKPKTYSETYVVEYVNGGWIATRNDLVEVN